MSLVNMNPADKQWEGTGEGGLYAYAIWPVIKTNCFVENYPLLEDHDVMIKAVGPVAEDFDRLYRETSRNLVFEASTVILLGSTDTAWFNDNTKNYFHVTRSDLTDAGKAVVETLEAMYGEATFVTLLDT